jgi:hypothetical protein
LGSQTPFVDGGRENAKAAKVWETKLHGFEDGIGSRWLFVDRTMLLFFVSRGCTVSKRGKGRASVNDIVSGVGGRGEMGFCHGGFDDGRLKELRSVVVFCVDDVIETVIFACFVVCVGYAVFKLCGFT